MTYDELQELRRSAVRYGELEQKKRHILGDILSGGCNNGIRIEGKRISQAERYVMRKGQIEERQCELITQIRIGRAKLLEECHSHGLTWQEERVLVLRYAEGRTWREVQEHLRVTEKTIFNIRQRALKKILEKI